MNRTWVLAALGLLALPCAFAFAQVPSAHANGVPQLVKLTYLAGVSNWGPKDAEGVLEFSFAEAYARVDVKNLAPQPGVTYEGWLSGGGGTPFKVGTVTVSEAGVGVLETKLSELSRYDYNMFVIAARSPAGAADAMPQDHSIAGRFTVIQDNGTPRAGDVAGRPGTLPDTGQAPASTRDRVARTFMVVLVTAGAGILVIRFIRRRERSA